MKRFFLLATVSFFIMAVLLAAGVLQYPKFKMKQAIEGVAEKAGGTNRFHFETLPDASWRTIVRPSPDLAYGAMAFDLSEGPLMITAPAHGDYWSLQFVDDETNSFAYAGSRIHGNEPVRLFLTTAHASVSGKEVVRSPSTRGVVVLRYLVRDAAEFPALDEKRRQVTVRPAGGP